MLKQDHENREGNDCFEGFAVDLMDAISKKIGFSYEMYVVHDGQFGAKLPNGEWNGIVGEILAKVS